MPDDFNEIFRQRRIVSSYLRETIAQTRRISELFQAMVAKNSNADVAPLLVMAEGLIASHKAAKIDNDGYTLDLIEDALFHVGKRLARECPDGRRQIDG